MGGQKKAVAKPYTIRLSTNALQNLDEITGYIAFVRLQPLNAVKVGDALFNVIEQIKTNPLAYRECNELPTKTKMYRRAVCLSWSIIFKITSLEIIVLGIIHRSRRPAATKVLRKIK